ncbi:MAG: InlB B-repeat-containing protein, partial [Clostridia bacterium]|nr:InlB B-repeat-containing protein [Clostridia bacterium]
FTAAEGGDPIDGETLVTGDIELYAQWTPNATEQCTLTFNAQGGSGAPAAITVDKGATATIPAQKPTKSGYTFIQWNTKADGTGTVYNYGTPGPVMNGNLTLYAIWRSNSANPTANAVLNVKASASVEYRADVTIKATATGVPAGYVLAVYDGNTQVAKGDNASVSYHVGNMKAGKTYDVKVVDANGNVQQDGSGNDLSKSCAISVNDGFFAKIIAFFKGLFGALPKITIEP